MSQEPYDLEEGRHYFERIDLTIVAIVVPLRSISQRLC